MRAKYEEMRSSIIEATSLVEALIDFGEDEAISDDVFDQGTFPHSLQSQTNSMLRSERKSIEFEEFDREVS